MGNGYRQFERQMIDRYGPAFVSRLKRNLIILLPGLPLMNLLLTPVPLGSLWLTLPVSIAYSWISAHFRFVGFFSGLTFLAAEFAFLVLAGEADLFDGSVRGLMLLIGAVLFYGVGVGLGLSEETRLQDGY